MDVGVGLWEVARGSGSMGRRVGDEKRGPGGSGLGARGVRASRRMYFYCHTAWRMVFRSLRSKV